ncbi:uncharacterized protein Bfra_005883 [Botrytis fragariae]|uniref:Uncharacterized protein n=1 Tax=Botrytis fragariae TaxID=1964551 RepID=A0A8H6EHJ6_9HELO|nr:uncharacterized protein Bfra_005883 [Botrytis fragariae]KAF5872522.1 hypothetical protein Bfra_005883 [Botrytis fragariae]
MSMLHKLIMLYLFLMSLFKLAWIKSLSTTTSYSVAFWRSRRELGEETEGKPPDLHDYDY